MVLFSTDLGTTKYFVRMTQENRSTHERESAHLTIFVANKMSQQSEKNSSIQDSIPSTSLREERLVV